MRQRPINDDDDDDDDATSPSPRPIAIGVRRRRRLRSNRHCATDTPPRLRKPMKRTLLWPSFLACEDLSLSLALREWWVGSDRGIESAVVGADHTEMEVRNDSIRFWIDSIGIGLILSGFGSILSVLD
jgi:hypothetical protein